LTRELGVARTDVDAGYEWVGMHSRSLVAEAIPKRSAGGPWYLGLFPASSNCGVVRASPADSADFRELGAITYRQFFRLREERLWLYRYGPGCARAGISSAFRLPPSAGTTA
jgi:hypothetical protein